MILSHKHKFIYIKTYKTASTSIETALSHILGEQDVITPASEELQHHRFEARQAQNYRLDHPAVPRRPLLKRLLRRPERYYHPSVGYYEHMPAWRVKTYVGDRVWGDYYKFSFERNPWDRQVSFFHYKNKNRTTPFSFEKFLERPKNSYVENFDLYSIDDEVAMDFVGKYENLEEDFRKIIRTIGLVNDVTLPVTNVSKSVDAKPYRAFYNDKSRRLIAKWYRREIELFGYEF